MSAISENNTVIDWNWLLENPNKKSSYSRFKHAEKYLSTWKGEFQGSLALKKISKLGIEIGKWRGYETAALKACDHNFGILVGGLGILALPMAASRAIQSLSRLSVDEKEDKVPYQRKVFNAVRAVSGAVSAYSSVAIFILKASPSFKILSNVVGCITELADLQISYSNYSKINSHSKCTLPVKKALDECKDYYFLCLVKNITSIACSVLGMAFFFSGASLVALLALSLFSTIFSIERDLYKQSQSYKKINFDTNNLVFV